ncbi:alcohol dehydrogenase catalytic domain-containing protein [Nocardiopsis sp. HNM0947]|uniref:Alcohol dehydrogenase catalytic domain-containing protein n=2 Tax=Nocardiopsis coralli TaxID=2772213 RepID=A0ABR9P2W6_9ACTN|nr:alcohol dehydrogenase catalytic domain-containing protein [Nocardiopsis coralli]
MRVARTVTGEQVEIQEAPVPAPGPGEALVRVHTVTLCGTDLHIWEDDYATELPIVQGHEFVGTVESLHDPGSGPNPGTRVAVSPMVTCGTCHACTIGRRNACAHFSALGCYQDGALAEYIAVPVQDLHPVPDGLPTELAPLAEPLSIALQAVRRGRPESGERALVLGCGPIGLLSTLCLTSLGVEVVAADTHPGRQAFAREFGATDTLLVDPDRGLDTDAVRAWAGRYGPPLVIEATGAPSSLDSALDAVANAGRVVAVGISDRTTELSLRVLPAKDLDLLGSRNSQDLIGEALELLTRHTGAARALVTHSFPLDRISEGFEAMRSRTELVGKVVIRMPGGER